MAKKKVIKKATKSRSLKFVPTQEQTVIEMTIRTALVHAKKPNTLFANHSHAAISQLALAIQLISNQLASGNQKHE